MMDTKSQGTKETIRTELEATRVSFHALLDSLSENDLRKRSLNLSWTNGEILAHMLFGFVILNALLPIARLWGRLPRWTSKPFAGLLNALTVPFNWINAAGARLQARVFTYWRIGKLYDRAYLSLLKQIDSIREEEWQNGMFYPTRWDSHFDHFMTIEKLFHYPVIHFNFHVRQIAQSTNRPNLKATQTASIS